MISSIPTYSTMTHPVCISNSSMAVIFNPSMTISWGSTKRCGNILNIGLVLMQGVGTRSTQLYQFLEEEGRTQEVAFYQPRLLRYFMLSPCRKEYCAERFLTYLFFDLAFSFRWVWSSFFRSLFVGLNWMEMLSFSNEDNFANTHKNGLKKSVTSHRQNDWTIAFLRRIFHAHHLDLLSGCIYLLMSVTDWLYYIEMIPEFPGKKNRKKNKT